MEDRSHLSGMLKPITKERREAAADSATPELLNSRLLAFRELEPLARTRLAGFFPLFHSRVAGKKAFLL
jgi:hypothetical protein